MCDEQTVAAVCSRTLSQLLPALSSSHEAVCKRVGSNSSSSVGEESVTLRTLLAYMDDLVQLLLSFLQFHGGAIAQLHAEVRVLLLQLLSAAQAPARKQAVACLQSLARVLSDAELSALLHGLLQLQQPVALSAAVRGLCSSVSARLLPFVPALMPKLVGLARQQADELGAEPCERREASLLAMASLVKHCGVVMHPLIDALLPPLEQGLSFDPNFDTSYESDSGEEELLPTFEADDDDEDDGNGVEDYAGDSEGEEYGDVDDDSFRVRRAAVKCVEELVTVLDAQRDELSSKRMPQRRQQELFLRLYSILLPRLQERQEAVQTLVIEVFARLLRACRGRADRDKLRFSLVPPESLDLCRPLNTFMKTLAVHEAKAQASCRARHGKTATARLLPLLRAGLNAVEAMLALLPDAQVSAQVGDTVLAISLGMLGTRQLSSDQGSSGTFFLGVGGDIDVHGRALQLLRMVMRAGGAGRCRDYVDAVIEEALAAAAHGASPPATAVSAFQALAGVLDTGAVEGEESGDDASAWLSLLCGVEKLSSRQRRAGGVLLARAQADQLVARVLRTCAGVLDQHVAAPSAVASSALECVGLAHARLRPSSSSSVAPLLLACVLKATETPGTRAAALQALARMLAEPGLEIEAIGTKCSEKFQTVNSPNLAWFHLQANFPGGIISILPRFLNLREKREQLFAIAALHAACTRASSLAGAEQVRAAAGADWPGCVAAPVLEALQKLMDIVGALPLTKTNALAVHTVVAIASLLQQCNDKQLAARAVDCVVRGGALASRAMAMFAAAPAHDPVVRSLAALYACLARLEQPSAGPVSACSLSLLEHAAGDQPTGNIARGLAACVAACRLSVASSDELLALHRRLLELTVGPGGNSGSGFEWLLLSELAWQSDAQSPFGAPSDPKDVLDRIFGCAQQGIAAAGQDGGVDVESRCVAAAMLASRWDAYRNALLECLLPRRMDGSASPSALAAFSEVLAIAASPGHSPAWCWPRPSTVQLHLVASDIVSLFAGADATGATAGLAAWARIAPGEALQTLADYVDDDRRSARSAALVLQAVLEAARCSLADPELHSDGPTVGHYVVANLPRYLVRPLAHGDAQVWKAALNLLRYCLGKMDQHIDARQELALQLPTLLPAVCDKIKRHESSMVIVQMGPMSTQVDTHLPLRLLSLECIQSLVELAGVGGLSRDAVATVLSCLPDALVGAYEARLLSHALLCKLVATTACMSWAPSDVDATLTALAVSIASVCKEQAVQQEREKHDEMLRSALAATEELRGLVRADSAAWLRLEHVCAQTTARLGQVG